MVLCVLSREYIVLVSCCGCREGGGCPPCCSASILHWFVTPCFVLTITIASPAPGTGTMQLSCSHPQRGVGHRNICSTSSRIFTHSTFLEIYFKNCIFLKHLQKSSRSTSIIFDVCFISLETIDLELEAKTFACVSRLLDTTNCYILHYLPYSFIICV